MTDVPKKELLRSLGYAGPYELLDSLLVSARLTTPHKARMSSRKRNEVADVLKKLTVRVCRRGDCQQRAQEVAGERQIVQAVSPGCCEICRGSAAAPELQAMVKACRAAGWKRLCIVGGSPKTRAEIKATVGEVLEVRLIDGTVARTRREALADLAWADHVVLWGSTELDHKVSSLYKPDNKRYASKVTTVVCRSIQQLWRHVAEAAENRRHGNGRSQRS